MKRVWLLLYTQLFTAAALYAAGPVRDCCSVSGQSATEESVVDDNRQTEVFTISEQKGFSLNNAVTETAPSGSNLAITDAYMMAGPGEDVVLTVQLQNTGTELISGFSLDTRIGGKVSAPEKIFLETVEPGQSVTVSYSVPATDGISVSADAAVEVLLAGLNRAEDSVAEDNIRKAEASYKRNVLLEEFTSERCVNCPYMADLIHDVLLNEVYAERVLLVTHHAGYMKDWLTSQADLDYLWFYNNGKSTYAPAVMFDRYPNFVNKAGARTPVGFVVDQPEFEGYIEKRLADFCAVDLSLKGEFDQNGTLKVNVSGTRCREQGTDGMHVCVYLLEDKVKAKSQSGGGVDYLHNSVKRSYNQVWGEPVTWNGDTFSYECELPVDPKWKKENLHVTAFVGRYNSNDSTDCIVENAIDLPFETVTGLESISLDKKVLRTEYYSLDGISVSNPIRGVFIEKTIYADGTVSAGKVLK